MRIREQTILALLSPGLPPVTGQHVLDLSEPGWTVSSKALNRTVPGRLPSQVHLDLFEAGVIATMGSMILTFAGLRMPTGRTPATLLLGCELTDHESTWLVFDGLDTFTTITFCDQIIGSTYNQFRQYHFDVSQVLKECKQEGPVLSINFGSAPNIANAIANGPSAEEWPAGVQITNEYPNRWYIRKEQSDFGWDWGPAFAPAGPWKPAYIVQNKNPDRLYVLNTDLDIYRRGQINHLPPDQSQSWVVNASIDVLGSVPQWPSMSVEIKDAYSGVVLSSGLLENVTVSGNSVTGVTVVDGRTPKLWWPNGMGDQSLYNVTIAVHNHRNQVVAEVMKRTGFRTIFLNQRNITEEQLAQGVAPGANWHFEINGREFYAKGSNIIPPDAFWPRVTPSRMERLFDAVTAGNQNMLRVWASGAYLHDFIYDLADEKGILLWSEFQFSDALYPVDDAFLENVAAEVVYNVRRVNHHPSLALWAGGNEIESLMLPMVRRADHKGYAKYVGEYEKLYISLILPLVYENTRSITYSPSSTTEGYLHVNLSAPVPMTERYSNTTPGSYYGDTDYYNYDTSVSFNYHKYPVGRFANEFGFHSMPSLQTWQQAVDPKDLYFNSSVVVLRNHHYTAGGLFTDNYQNSSRGMGEMTMGVESYYPIPSKSDPVANFSAWCHATQLFQADMYKAQIQFYRRGSGMPERQLGSLYWQLEDTWQAPTWAGIEYDGRWKMLHYVARDIYEPIIVSPFWNYTTGDLEVYVTSDLWEPAQGTVNLTWVDLSGKSIAGNAGTPESIPFSVGALNATDVYSANVADLSPPDLTDSILILSLAGEGYLPNARTRSEFRHENQFTPVFPKDLALRDPKLELAYNPDTRTFTVEATAGVSLYTWLDYPAGVVGYFEQNGFVLLPGMKKEIGFVVQEGSVDEDWMRSVTVTSLWDQKVRE
ncbi:beta-mannosidase mndA [Aspergillus clavatus NRRL 1]|uniref:Beta-mannosidase A n=1 Tax=Aspergillus clavatus (strain ATCC 1007 / CBS 513.65 / DSM 816 / NCTC 3887 / NRRL 1 / QM 1276 / 107) TaxID=344612 RepID=MANBA_ASPCL|nr:beta-mannosidase [Aspergillus clavatus NRRL 1]A1CTM5.1 RecName: Full=Beta-mannosidase A; AltName: Full=Mannanase A; Short=Mannase A; Flags: Precursor [Aspergillus clavatus NRRL 1]EAW06662.1 beta-mannosidase [Aspergillus clavatus NRRL 1]